MPRIEFDGTGQPIPSIALPPFGSDSDLPPTVLTFTDSTIFSVEPYRDLGYTHFEVTCVGAAGGRGGDGSNNVPYVGRTTAMLPVPNDIWELYLSRLDNTAVYIPNFQIPGNPNYPPGGVPGYDYGWPVTRRQYEIYTNPNHLMQYVTYSPILLFPTYTGMGGGGGGGGMHRVSGYLSSLDDDVPVNVGQAGPDAPLGQVKQFGLWTPGLIDVEGSYVANDPLYSYLRTYPLPHPSYPNPQPGVDGGASTFATTVCQASGGKGGSPGMVWDGAKFVLEGFGGDGGIGGRSLPGGGGLGAKMEGTNGSDGIWRPETGVGAGGGGGRSPGEPKPAGPPVYSGGFPYTPMTDPLATSGGQGSYSFADTSVYGQRQSRQAVPYPLEARLVNGVVVFQGMDDRTKLIMPGGGGGARPMKNLRYGSRAPGYSPNGVVVIRLTKINT